MTISFKTLTISIITATSSVSTSCTSPHPAKAPEFWEVNTEFVAPSDWETRNFAKAFSIQIPSYMHRIYNSEDRQLDSLAISNDWREASYTSNRDDGTHDCYAYISVKYMKGKDRNFNGYLDRLDLNNPQVKTFCDMLVKQQIGTGKLIKIISKDIQLISDANCVLDICYQRVGNTENEGPVTVHIFFAQNYNEAVQVTVSYHDKDKDTYKDLFNIINTLKWNKLNKAHLDTVKTF